MVYHNRKVLLVHRNDEPAKNQWWFPGGRIYKNERIEETAIRKAKEEVGLNIKLKNLVGVYDFFDSKGPLNDLKTGVHAIGITFLAEPIEEDFQIKLDKTSSEYKWINKNEDALHPYIKKVLKESKVFDQDVP